MTEHSPSSYSPAYLEEYNGNRVIIAAVIFIVLETLFVAFRFIARGIQKTKFGWDDAFIVAGSIFSYALIGVCLADVTYGGAGYHEVAVAKKSPEKLVIWAKFAFVIPIMYLPAIVFPKLSIIALYLRLFSERFYRIASWITAGLVVANGIGALVPAFVMCIPLEYFWNRKLPGGGRCIDINAWYRWSSMMNIITDVIMLVLPIPMVLKLQSSSRTKFGLAFTFAIGSIGVVTAVIRFVGFFTEDFSRDGTWTATRLIILSIMEPGLYLIAACIMCLKPLLRYVWNKTPLATNISTRTTTNNSLKLSRNHMFRMERIPSRGNESPHNDISFTESQAAKAPREFY